jgi:hypothetical protein
MMTRRAKTQSLTLSACALAFALLLSACATPEGQTRSALIKTGLTPPVADCMAGRMVDRLSLGQLQRLGRLERLKRAGDFQEFLQATRGLQDPEILGVVSSSGLICAARN